MFQKDIREVFYQKFLPSSSFTYTPEYSAGGGLGQEKTGLPGM